LDWNPAARVLLDVCFCSACRAIAEQAGVDPQQVARSVRVHVDRLSACPPMSADCVEDDTIQAYRSSRATDCAGWLTRLGEAISARRLYLVHEVGVPLPYSADLPMQRLARLPTDSVPPDEHIADLRQPVELRPAGWIVPVGRPTFDSAAPLVRLISEAVAAGVRYFDFEGLPTAPSEAVTWLKQAVRFARRGKNGDKSNF
jgi:hypothetical protein